MIDGYFIQSRNWSCEDGLVLAAASTRGLVCTVQCCGAGDQTGGEEKAEGSDGGDVDGEARLQVSSTAPRSGKGRDGTRCEPESKTSGDRDAVLFGLFSPVTSVKKNTGAQKKEDNLKMGLYVRPSIRVSPSCSVTGGCVPQTCIATRSRSRSRKNRSGR